MKTKPVTTRANTSQKAKTATDASSRQLALVTSVAMQANELGKQKIAIEAKSGKATSEIATSSLYIGKDEMNLAEYPLTRLGTRDKRDVIKYSGWTMDKQKRTHRQTWTVRGAAGLGLPGELGDRVLLALMALTFRQPQPQVRVEFTRHRLLRMMGAESIGQQEYKLIEKTLRQLLGITIESENAYFDKASAKRIRTTKAFHLIANLRIRSHGDDEDGFAVEEGSGQAENAHVAPRKKGKGSREIIGGYIEWSPQFYRNLQTGYIRNIDLGFYYALPTPLARRLYRFLDKAMHHRNTCEMDIFELTDRLGQQRYPKPSLAFRKLKPSIDALIEERFLKSAQLVKHRTFTRIRFERWEKGAFAKHQERQHKQEAQLAEAKQKLDVDAQTAGTLSAAWATVVDGLGDRLTPTVHALLGETELVSLDGGSAVVVAQSRFVAERLTTQRELVTTLAAALEQRVGESVTKIAFVDVKSIGTLKNE